MIDAEIFTVVMDDNPRVEFGSVDSEGMTFYNAPDWNIQVDQMSFGNKTIEFFFPALVDTGTSFTILPATALSEITDELKAMDI